MASGALDNKYSKLEVQRFQEKIDEMNIMYGGIKEMHQKVGALFVSDINEDINAVREAKKLGIPIVAIADTNTDPTLVDYPIPANDDAIKAVKLIVDYIEEAVEKGKSKIKPVAKQTEEKQA